MKIKSEHYIWCDISGSIHHAEPDDEHPCTSVDWRAVYVDGDEGEEY
jgi:hypothetical protein